VAGVLRSSRAVIDHPDRVDFLCILNTFYAAVPGMRLPELIEVFARRALGIGEQRSRKLV
jgi:hypothetical protein